MMTYKKSIDWTSFIFLIIYACFIFCFSLISHLIDSQYSIIWVVPLITLLLAIPYLLIRHLWYLYISIAPSLLFFTWVFIFSTWMNRGLYFNNYHYIFTTYIFFIIPYAFICLITIKIFKKRANKS